MSSETPGVREFIRNLLWVLMFLTCIGAMIFVMWMVAYIAEREPVAAVAVGTIVFACFMAAILTWVKD